MKNHFYKLNILFFFCVTFNLNAQDAKNTVSKMDDFASKTGVIVKFEDTKMPDLKLVYGIAEAKVRKLTSGGEIKCFYQISNEGKYGTKTASIAYEDLLEMQKALIVLKEQSTVDFNTTVDYMENKFITDDGFQIGYYVSNSKLSWYMKLEKYGNGNTIFIKNIELIESAFSLAIQKINEIK